MLLFEYTRRMPISPTSLINYAPSIWTWTNPYMGIADWAYDMYEEAPVIDTSMTFMLTSIRIGTVMLTTVSSYEACVLTVNSFYWDNDNQVAYMHLQLHPHSLSSIDSSPVFGVTYGRPVEFNGIVYNNTLLSKPSVERNTEPVVYQKMATQSLSIELINDELWGVDPLSHKPYKYYRFDNTSDLNGQSTYLRYGEDGETDYSKLRLLHKGIISKITKSGTRLNIVCDDVRTRQDATWPTYTYEDAGYTVDDIDEDLLTSVIPDGFGYNEKMPMVCVNKSYAVIQKDDDDEIVLPSNELTWDINSWTKSGIITTRIDDKIGGFDSFRIAKSTSSNGYVNRSFTATDIKHKISGYIRCDVANTPTGNTVVSIAGKAVINFQLIDHTYTATYGSNVRVKYTVDDSGKVTAFFSMEAQELTIGSSYTLYIYADDSSSSSSAIVVSAIRVSEVEYPQFRVAKSISDVKTLYFDGVDDYVDPSLSIAPSIYGVGFTLSCKCNIHEATSATSVIIGNRYWDSTDSEYNFIKITPSKVEYAALNITSHSSAYGFEYDTWLTITVTFDGTTLRVYRDGILVTSNEVIQVMTKTVPFYIGADGFGGTGRENAEGSILNVLLYDRALSPNEVVSIADGMHVDDGLIHAWMMNEGTGTTALDSVGSANGTVYGATWEYPLDVYYEEDGEFIKVNNVISTEPSSALVTIHDIDAHEDGVITNGLKKFFCSSVLRPETNPLDIITVLNDEATNIPYIDEFYDKTLCESEKLKLSNISMYTDKSDNLTTLIETIQSGSTVGFRYDDVDKIYILCDDPNRPVARVIQSEEIIDRDSITLESDLTLYADEVTINYGVDRSASNPYKERNTDYKQDVLLRYSYTRPLTYESLLISKASAINKSVVLLEDLSVVRDTCYVTLHGLDILDTVDLYSIVRVNLQLSEERPFAGWLRMQVIGINVDTDFEFVTLHLRQRDYSEAFADVTGSYGDVTVAGYVDEGETDVVALGEGEDVIGYVEE